MLRKLSFVFLWVIAFVLLSAGTTQNGNQVFTGPIYVDGDIYRLNNGVTGKATQETTAAITLYVRTDGSDSNTCMADSASGACLTIQAAVNKIPKYLSHAVAIHVGAGTFGGFSVVGYVAGIGGSMTIDGVLGAPTLAHGTTSGTATGGDDHTCIDAGQTWDGSQLIGMYVLVAGEYRIIRANDGTTLDLVGDLSATCSGKAYSIVEHKTVLSTDGSLGYGNIEFTNSRQRSSSSFTFQNFKCTSVSKSGVFASYGTGLKLVRIWANNTGYDGFFMQELVGQLYMTDLMADQCIGNGFMIVGGNTRIAATRGDRFYAALNSGAGIAFSAISRADVNDMYAEQNSSDGVQFWSVGPSEVHHVISTFNTGSGVFFWASNNFDMDDTENEFTYNGNYGIELDGEEYFSSTTVGNGTLVDNNSESGILVGINSILVINGALTSSDNNTDYGIEVKAGGVVKCTSTTTLTGDLGDVLIVGPSTVLDWSTDFASNGDAVVNLASGTRIYRKD